VDEAAITTYVGEIRQTLSGRGFRRAFLVHAYPQPPIDPCFPIWDEPGSAIFHRSLQVWVMSASPVIAGHTKRRSPLSRWATWF
jgi:hypothetical protein